MNASSFQRRASFALAFLLPPLLVSGLFAVSTVKEVMRHKEPAVVMLPARAGADGVSGPKGKAPQPIPAPIPPSGGWPMILRGSSAPSGPTPPRKIGFVLNPSGTETLSLLGPWDVLARSGAFQLVTLAPTRQLIPLTTSMSVLPDFSFEATPQLDVLWVLPGVDPANPEVLAFIQSQAPRVKWIVAGAEAAQTLAKIGLLDHEKATAPFLILPSLREQFPAVNWEGNAPVIGSNRFYTSGGAGLAPELALQFLKTEVSSEVYDRVRKELSIPSPPAERSERLTAGEATRLLLELGLGWGRTYYSVALEPGASELGLAAWLEVPARGLSTRVSSISPRRGYVLSEHGLTLVASEGLDDGYPPHALVFPPNPSLVKLADSQNPSSLFHRVRHANFGNWEDQVRVPTLHLEDRKGGDQIAAAIDHVENAGRLGSMAPIIEKLMEWPSSSTLHAPTSPLGDWRTWGYLTRFIVMGLLGVWGFGKFGKMIDGRKKSA